jgi:glycosyltransferase involved in cell wall biosynthesis
MMSVEINGRFLTQPITGVQRYASEIVRALDRHLASSPCLRSRYSFRLITPPHAEGSLELNQITRVSTGRLQGHAWEQLELPARVGRRVLVSLGNTAPMITRNVVTIHDAAVFAVPEAFSPAFRRWYQILIPLLGRTALRVVTISEFSRNELAARAGIRKDRVDVIPQGCEHLERSPPDETVFQRLPVRRGEYILAVGSQAPHKNIGLLLEALRRMKPEAPPLVLAGGINPRVFGPAVTGEHDRVHSAGYVTDAELKALYRNAQCFVFPSRYEGFGIPPLEAMLSGCPVIVSRAASLPEVCGDAALYCDPRDPDDLARQIERLRDSPADREEYRRRGLERARGFTWDRAAGALVTLLDRVQSS